MSAFRSLIAGLCFVGLLTETRAADRPAVAGNEDMLCGPLCVTYLLRSFGRPADVDVIAAEAEWGDGRGGATMESLVASLRRRGLAVTPLKVTAGVPFRTAVPALVHTRGADGVSGHYVVLLPSGTDAVRLWDPSAGLTSAPVEEFATTLSGVVALVADGPVPTRAIEPVSPGSTFEVVWWFALPAALGGCAVAAAARARRARPSGVPSVS